MPWHDFAALHGDLGLANAKHIFIEHDRLDFFTGTPMAKKDGFSIREEFECVKEVNCGICGTVFQFPCKTLVDGSGPNKPKARQDAFRQATVELESDVGIQHCPTCGALQTCMEASQCAIGHGCAIWFAAIVFVIAVGLGWLLNERLISFPLPVFAWLVVAMMLPAFAYNIWLARLNMNRNLMVGLREAKSQLEDGKVTIVSDNVGDAIPKSLPRPLGIMKCIMIVLLVVGIGALPAAEIMRIASGWPSNKSSFPPVAGPGEEVTLYWPNSLESLKGFWKGTTVVQYTDMDETLPLSALNATCRTEDWGNFVGGKRVRNTNTTIWTKVTLPGDPSLAGKTILLPSTISVTYPYETGMFGFENRSAEFEHEFQFRLSSLNAASTYYSLWWTGILAGGSLITLSGYILRQLELRRLKVSPRPKTLKVRRVTDLDEDEDVEYCDID